MVQYLLTGWMLSLSQPLCSLSIVSNCVNSAILPSHSITYMFTSRYKLTRHHVVAILRVLFVVSTYFTYDWCCTQRLWGVPSRTTCQFLYNAALIRFQSRLSVLVCHYEWWNIVSERRKPGGSCIPEGQSTTIVSWEVRFSHWYGYGG